MTERSSDSHRGGLDFATRSSIFNDGDFAQAYNDFHPAAQSTGQSGDHLVMDDPFPPSSGSDQALPPAGTDQIPELPLLDPKLAEQIKAASSVDFATAKENEAAGAQPDYRIIVGEDGTMKLEKVGDGDPLADGKLNIEVPAKGDESLAEAITQADQNLKEYIREMMAYWQQNHPNEPYPGWWTDILNHQVSLPADTKPVPIQNSNAAPPQPETAPEQQRPADGGGGGGDSGSGGGGGGGGYRGGVGPGYSGRDRPAPIDGDSSNLLQNVKIVTEVAKQYGVDPELAVATMLQESGGNSRAIGDGGDSVGLFQLNQNGLGAGMSVEERMDPRKNAEIAIKHMADTQAVDQNGDGQVTGGDLAVTSQNPAESVRDEYVANVDGPLRQQAHQLIEQAEKMGDFDPSAETGAWGGYQNGRVPQSALVDVHGFNVAPSIADNLNALLVAAEADGVWSPGQPYATGTYRDYDSQVRLKAEKGDMAATPGKSMHGWGLAIDFNMNNRPLIDWLSNNAERFGFKNLPGEPWHYSTNGH